MPKFTIVGGSDLSANNKRHDKPEGKEFRYRLDYTPRWNSTEPFFRKI